jgi:hypothetical protein
MINLTNLSPLHSQGDHVTCPVMEFQVDSLDPEPAAKQGPRLRVEPIIA